MLGDYNGFDFCSGNFDYAIGDHLREQLSQMS